jgi:cytochrome oxidase Cu insertion factor (SCO1/SenC/PrrC family)/cytochrome c2
VPPASFGNFLQEKKMQRRVLAGITMLAALATAVPHAVEAQSRRLGEGYFPNLPVVTHEGKTLRFYDDLLKGKIVVINFIYTSCQDICPIATARLAQVEEKLGEKVGRDFFFISMTVDPEHDTPERLNEYAKGFGAGPGWTFVTGRPEDVRAINYKFGERSTSLTEHRNEIVVGNEATGQWQRDNLFGDLDRLVITILGMDPKWRDEVRVVPHSPASNIGLKMSNQPGQALFTKICAPCHTIGVGDRVGPDLRGITQRRDHAWLSSYIRNPARLRAQKDPEALALAAQYPAVRMPALGLAEVDATDLINYLEAQTARLKDAEASSPSPGRDHDQHHDQGGNHEHHKH